MKSIDTCPLLWCVANVLFDLFYQSASIKFSVTELIDFLVFHKLVQITIACVIEITVLTLCPSDNENRSDTGKIRDGLFTA